MNSSELPKPHMPPQYCYDDAQLYFSHAIAAAKHAGLADEVERLSQRADDIRRVYNSQFRGVGQ